VVLIQIPVFWDKMLCGLLVHRHLAASNFTSGFLDYHEERDSKLLKHNAYIPVCMVSYPRRPDSSSCDGTSDAHLGNGLKLHSS